MSVHSILSVAINRHKRRDNPHMLLIELEKLIYGIRLNELL